MATPDQIRRRGRWSLVLGILIAALAVIAVAYADNTLPDGDGATPVDANPLALGNVACGVATTDTALIAINRVGGSANNTFQNSTDVTVSVLAVSGAGLSATVPASPDNKITLPSNWEGLANNTRSADTVTSEVTINSSVEGLGSGSVTYRASGMNQNGVNTNRDALMNVTWTTGSCAPADTTAPVITPIVSGTLGNDGWYTSDVTVTWSVVDNESAISSSSGCASTTISSDTTGTTLTCTATSAGGTASQSVTIKRDATAPTVVPNPAADSCSAPGDNGWCRGEQTAGFSASDGTSGLDPEGAATRDFTKSTTTNGASIDIPSGAVSDMAGNSNPGIDAGPFMIDSAAPTVMCQSPAPTFVLNQPGAQVSASVTDATSLPVNAAEYGNAETSSVGGKTVSITGHDNAGNSTSANCAYTVGFNFTGLFAPIDRPNTMNVSKAGQAIPLKWRLSDYFGNPVTSLASVTITVASIACSYSAGTPDEVEEYAAGSSGLQNLGDGYYQFNWKTPTSYASSCKQLNLNLGEGSVRTNLALISFKK